MDFRVWDLTENINRIQSKEQTFWLARNLARPIADRKRRRGRPTAGRQHRRAAPVRTPSHELAPRSAPGPLPPASLTRAAGAPGPTCGPGGGERGPSCPICHRRCPPPPRWWLSTWWQRFGRRFYLDSAAAAAARCYLPGAAGSAAVSAGRQLIGAHKKANSDSCQRTDWPPRDGTA